MTRWRQFRAVLYDAVLEHRDRKVNYFLLACSALSALTLASLRIETATAKETVEVWCTILPSVGKDYLAGFYPPHPAMPRAGPVRVETGGAGAERWSFEVVYPNPAAIGWAMEIWAASDQGKDPKRAALAARRYFNHAIVGRAIETLGHAKALFPETGRATQEVIDRLVPLADRWARSDRPTIPTEPADQVHYLAERWESFGFRDVAVERTGEGTFAVSVSPRFPKEARPVKTVRVLWLYTFDARQVFSEAHVLGMIQAGLVRGAAGSDHFFYMGMAVLLALFVTGGSLSRGLAKGSVEWVLAKPVSRDLFLLSRYAAGVGFVAVHAAVLFGAAVTALAAGAGVWEPRLLVGIPLVTGLFAALHALSAAVAVAARSAVFVPVFSMGTLLVCGQIAELHRYGLVTLRDDIPAPVAAAARGLYWMLPKTVDLLGHGTALLVRSEMSETLVRKLDLAPAVVAISAGWAIATTAAFSLSALAVACWIFRRKEP